MSKKFIISVMVAGASVVVATIPALASDYTVTKGDTLNEISNTFNTPIQRIVELNPEIYDIDLIFTGDTLELEEAKAPEKEVEPAEEVKPVEEAPAETAPATSLSGYDFDLLARIVEAEAKGEPYTGKVAVANVVLNRVDSSQFPNSIHGVIYQAGQFSPVANGSINKPASAEAKQAVQDALNGDRSSVAGALFFYNASIASNSWQNTLTTTAVIGNHTFKK